MRIIAGFFLLLFFGMLLFYTGFLKLPVRFGLDDVVHKQLEGTKGEYSVAIKNLKTGESYCFKCEKVYVAASLYKLWVMAEAFRQIEKGELKEDEILSSTISDLNQTFQISSESAELTTGEISLSVRLALKQMITISHNYAALLLAERVKHSKISDFLEDYGFNKSSLGEGEEGPVTTASDTLIFFEKLYKGELATPNNTQKILDLLKAQQLNEKLPKYLPKEVPVAHKTGEIGYYSHDAGIVFSPKSDYIIVVLSKTQIPAAANTRIANISKAVYAYFKDQFWLK